MPGCGSSRCAARVFCSLVLLCDGDGRPLIGRDFRGEVGSVRARAFCSERLRYMKGDAVPIVYFDGSTFLLRRLPRQNATLVGATSNNTNAALAMSALVALERLLVSFGVLGSDNIRPWTLASKVHVFYAILDEAFDHGVPQILDERLLRKMMLLELPTPVASTEMPVAEGNLITAEATSAAPWRSTQIMKEGKSTVLMDIVERVTAQLDSAGHTITAEVHGEMKVQCRLGGLPTCMLVLNDAAGPAHSGSARQFHPAVQLDRLASTNEIVFSPPQNDFQVMTWQSRGHVTPPLKVTCSRIDHGRTRLELVVNLKPHLPSSDLTIFDIRCSVPLPALTSGIRTRLGGAPSTAKWVRSEQHIKWKVRELGADGEASLAVEVTMAPRTHDGADAQQHHHHLAPLVVRTFSVPGHSATGLRVRALRVWDAQPPDKQVTKLVRYSVTAGVYEVRMPGK